MPETIFGKQFSQKVIPLIDSAKKSIDIVVFDWRWYPQDPGSAVQLFNQAIVRAVRRGVKTRAIVNNDEILSTLNALGVLAKRLTARNLVHAKMIIFDNEKAVVGSHNYTASAFQMNFEVSVILDHSENIAELASFFNNLYNSNG